MIEQTIFLFLRVTKQDQDFCFFLVLANLKITFSVFKARKKECYEWY